HKYTTQSKQDLKRSRLTLSIVEQERRAALIAIKDRGGPTTSRRVAAAMRLQSSKAPRKAGLEALSALFGASTQ
ncbi:MAG: hypothetical protein ACK55Z_11900, partial [bacterium]